MSYLFDDLVGAGQDRRRSRQAERCRRREIDRQLEGRGLLDRQISRLGVVENCSGINAGQERPSDFAGKPCDQGNAGDRPARRAVVDPGAAGERPIITGPWPCRCRGRPRRALECAAPTSTSPAARIKLDSASTPRRRDCRSCGRRQTQPDRQQQRARGQAKHGRPRQAKPVRDWFGQDRRQNNNSIPR